MTEIAAPPSTEDVPLVDNRSYRRLIGKLIYLTITRPDITFAVQQLSQFLDSATTKHLKAAHRILKYLVGSSNQGIFFSSSSSLHLKGFCDSDWATCPMSRKSVSGNCVFLGNSLISWRSKKQGTVSRSSSEAEYRSLASLTCELQWLLFLLHDLQVSHPQPALIFCDNQSAIHIAKNSVFHERTKHLEIDLHITRQKLKEGIIHLLPISSSQQIADLFTKPLAPSQFQPLLIKLGIHDLAAPACGGVSSSELQLQCKTSYTKAPAAPDKVTAPAAPAHNHLQHKVNSAS